MKKIIIFLAIASNLFSAEQNLHRNLSNNVDTIDNLGHSAITNASIQGITNTVKLLIDNGANVNVTDSNDNGWTPLIWACRRKHIDIAQLLINNGANINARDNKGYTALIHASMKGLMDVVNLLIDNGANIDIKDFKDHTALTYASAIGHIDVVKLLIDKGANINENKALLYASKTGHLAIVNLLTRRVADNIQVEQKLARYILQEHIYDILAQCRTVDELNDQIIKLELSGDKRLKQIIDTNALQIIYHYLQNKFHNEFKEFCFEYFKEGIISKGPLYYKYLEPIIFISENLKLNSLKKLLINKNIDTNIEYYQLYEKYDISDIIFQMLAAADKDVKAVAETRLNRLLRLGLANVRGDRRGITSIMAITIAVRFLVGISQKTCIDMINLLLNFGANINAKDDKGQTAIIIASDFICVNIVKTLIAEGANVNSIDDEGTTALMKVCGCEIAELVPDAKDIIELLLNNGANLQKENNFGYTSLMLASMKGNVEIVKYLILKGANIDAQNNKGDTALILAKHSDVVQLLTNCSIKK